MGMSGEIGGGDTPVEHREAAEKAKRVTKRRQLRRERTAELMELSSDELSQEELTARFDRLYWRYGKIASLIPTDITLHLKDGKDDWDLTAQFDENGDRYMIYVRPEPYNEDEIFEIVEDGDRITIEHSESGQLDLSGSRNSERELRPAEELFDRLMKPLEEKIDITKGGYKFAFDPDI